MTTSEQFINIPVGAEVYGTDGDKVGRIAEVYPAYVTVEKGIFFPTDYFIPVSAIQTVQGDNVYLNVSKDVAVHNGWDRVPTTQELTGVSNDEVLLDTPADARRYDDALDARMADQAVVEDEIHIPLAEEELTATVRPVEAGAAHIRKRVVSEDRVLEVPVTEEQIRVERRVVDRPIDGGDVGTFEEIVVDVPLRAEVVDVQKQARIAEDVVVKKEAIQHTERIKDTVRHEEVVFDDDVSIDETRP